MMRGTNLRYIKASATFESNAFLFANFAARHGYCLHVCRLMKTEVGRCRERKMQTTETRRCLLSFQKGRKRSSVSGRTPSMPSGKTITVTCFLLTQSQPWQQTPPNLTHSRVVRPPSSLFVTTPSVRNHLKIDIIYATQSD